MNPLEFVFYMQILIGVIMADYIMIAADFGYQAYRCRKLNWIMGRQMCLVFIFLLCAICGYGLRAIQTSTLVDMCLESPLSPQFILILHSALALFSGAFLLSDSPREIMLKLAEDKI
jgi:uncharacterized membrane protein